MEELLALLFEVVFEIVAQILVELPWDQFIGRRERKHDEPPSAWVWAFWSVVLGGAVGGASLWLHPDTFIKSEGARIAYLVLAPPLSALVSWELSRVFVRRGREWITPRLHAICAFCFALALTAIRFTYAHHS